MPLDFKPRDVPHNVTVKFIRAFLPLAKKSYYLKAVHQPVLDVHGIASKADVYNISTSPKVIEEGLNAGLELIYYLVADGYKIKTPLFNLKISVPGEYEGSETSLAEGIYPKAKMQSSPEFRKYLKEKVKLIFDGVDSNTGSITKAIDEATGLADKVVSRGKLLTIQGKGLKIDSDEEHRDQAGVYFVPSMGVPIKAEVIAVNEPRTLKIVVPECLAPGTEYKLAVETMSSVKHGGQHLKTMRHIESKFSLAA